MYQLTISSSRTGFCTQTMYLHTAEEAEKQLLFYVKSFLHICEKINMDSRPIVKIQKREAFICLPETKEFLTLTITDILSESKMQEYAENISRMHAADSDGIKD